MPADPYRHVSIGERLDIPAAGYNAAMDAAKSQRTGVVNTGRSIPQVGRNTGVVLIKNTSESDIPRYGILGIDGVIFDHDASADEFLSSRVLFEGVTPVDPDHVSKFVVSLEMIPDGEIGRAVISGYVQAQVNIADTDHTCAKIKDATVANLTSTAGTGSPIIYKPTGTGVKWCVVRIGNTVIGHDRCTALLKGALDSGDESTTVDNVAPIKGTDPVGGVAATEITAYNIHEWDGDNNAKCRIEWNRTTEHWELYQVTCP